MRKGWGFGICAVGLLCAQSTVRVDSRLVLVPVTVADAKDRPVTGLRKENFRLFDNQVEQAITHFAMDDSPLAVGLVFDGSRSMKSKLRRSQMAAAAFLRTANPEDEFFLVQFNESPQLTVPLTRDADAIEAQLGKTEAAGKTALYDAIYYALDEIKKSRQPRKALLVLSDGGDNSSRYSETELLNLVRERDVLIYTIGIFERGQVVLRPELVAGPGRLALIAEATGGRHFRVGRLSELPAIAGRIGVELRNRYVLGYTPSQTERDGKYHKVQVRVMPPAGMAGMRAFWRAGYYAPEE